MAGRKRYRIEDLAATVKRLADQVAVLTQAVDALTDEIQWRNNQARDTGERPTPFVLTSMPADLCTSDWHTNRVRRHGQPPAADDSGRRGRSTLFD